MIKLILMITLWFPFNLPKDTIPKVIYINSYEKVAVNHGHRGYNIKVTKGKSIEASVRVRVIIPATKRRMALVKGVNLRRRH